MTISESQAKHNLRAWKKAHKAKQPVHNHRFDYSIACRMLHKETNLPCDASAFHKVIENTVFAVSSNR
jgi:hypothetical protein